VLVLGTDVGGAQVIAIDDILRPPSYADFDDVYIVTELMDTDLHQIIGSPQPLTDDHWYIYTYTHTYPARPPT
jgi:hypothetical protein